jgi:DNA-binding PadR family transcriptional regulator
MKGTYLGEYEELVLLLVAMLGDDAYGLAIRKAFMKETRRSTAIGAVHAALSRMEKKGYLHSYLGEASSERGGRRKRIFQVTAEGKKALEQSRSLRNQIWEQIPAIHWKGLQFKLA